MLAFVADTKCRSAENGDRTCYKLIYQHLNWTESRANCKRLGDGADLVSVETAEENRFLLNMVLGELFTCATYQEQEIFICHRKSEKID